MKWCLVIAGVKDLGRPAEKLSVSQNLGALITTWRNLSYAYGFIPSSSTLVHTHSADGDGLHLGPLLPCHHARELLAGSRESLRHSVILLTLKPPTSYFR